MAAVDPAQAGSVEQLARVERMFEDAERVLNARLDDILARGPEWFREEARLRRLLAAARAAMADIATALDEPTLAAGLGEIYAAGATEQSGVLGQAFQWAQPHFGAVDRIAADTFSDLLTATTYVEDAVKGVIRQAAKLNTGRKLTTGKTAVQAGNVLAKDLRASGIGVVTYRNGARHGVGEYARMVMRTKTAVAYNAGSLNHSTAAGTKFFEIFDGADCGLSYHDDPTLANGLVVSALTAAAFAIAHPNCRRSFGARPDVEKLPHDQPTFDPSTTAAQRADQAAFEKFLRDQQRASRNRRARVPRSKITTKRTPRKPRAQTAVAPPAPAPLAPGEEWYQGLSEGERGRVDAIIDDPVGIIPHLTTTTRDDMLDLIESAPAAGEIAFMGGDYRTLAAVHDLDSTLLAAQARVGRGLEFDTLTTATRTLAEAQGNLVFAFETRGGSVGNLVRDKVLVHRAKWEMTRAETVGDQVVLYMREITTIDRHAPAVDGLFLGRSGMGAFAPTHPESGILPVKWGDPLLDPPKNLVSVGKVSGDSFGSSTVLYDETVGQRLADKGLGTTPVVTKLRDNAKVLRPAIDPINYTPTTLRSIAREAQRLGYDAVDFGRGTGVVILNDEALVRVAARREVTSGGLRGNTAISAADMRVDPVDAAARARADRLLRDVTNAEAKRVGIMGEQGTLHDVPDVTSFSSQAAGAMKQFHEERIAADIASRIDDFPGLREWLDSEMPGDAQMNQYLTEMIAGHERVRLRGDASKLVTGYDQTLTLEGIARAKGFTTTREFVESSVAKNVEVLKASLKNPDDLARLVEGESRAFLSHYENHPLRPVDLSDEELARLGVGRVEAVIERRVARITDGWAGSSGDSTASSVALQVVAAEKYGVSTDSMWAGLDVLHDSRYYHGSAASFRQEVVEFLNREGPMLEAYLDGAYNATQQFLAENGIDEVVLVRGMTFGGEGAPAIPESLLGMRGPTKLEMDTGKVGPVPPDSSYSARVGYGESKVVRAIGNPLQSWSTVPAVSERFARGGEFGAIMQAKVGAGRVLAFPATGPGCLAEFEWVLIGIDDVPVTLSRIK